jgi:hypothetical protein
MRAILIALGLVACSGESAIVRVPVVDLQLVDASLSQGTADALASLKSQDVPAAPAVFAQPADAPSVEGTTWSFCDPYDPNSAGPHPDPHTFTFLAGGTIMAGTYNGLTIVPKQGCNGSNWSQTGNSLRFECNNRKSWDLHIEHGMWVGQSHLSAIPDQDVPACFRRIPGHP